MARERRGWARRAPDGAWRACWRDRDGRQRSRSGFASERAALLAALQESAAAESAVEPRRAPTWSQWSARWLAERDVEPSTERSDRQRARRYLEPRWGAVRLDEIARRDVQAWVRELGSTPALGRDEAISPSTVARVYRLMSASMRAAVRAGEIASSPCSDIVLPRPAPGPERFLTRAEVDAIVHHIHDRDRSDATLWRAVVVLGTETGMRMGELAGLHWHRVDTARGLIAVVESWDPTARRVKAYPKSRKPRAVPITDRAAAALAELRARRDGASTCGLPHSTGRCHSPLVLRTSAGNPVDPHNFGWKVWRPACEAAGVSGARPHDMRHTYASWLVQRGVPLQQVSELLGHSSMAVTQRYAHLAASQHAAVLAALNQ